MKGDWDSEYWAGVDKNEDLATGLAELHAPWKSTLVLLVVEHIFVTCR
jgi:hypothetical protein